MVMADNEGGGNDVVVMIESIGPKSPWKKRSTDLEGSDEKSSPAMGVKSWPDLSDAQRSKQRISSATDGVAPVSTVPPLALPLNMQGSTVPPRSQASGNPVTSHKHAPVRHPKSNIKRYANGVPPPPVPLFNQPPMSIPPIFQTRVPAPHISVSGYAYPPLPGPFPSVKTHLERPGGKQLMQVFVPPVRGFNSYRNFQPSQRGDPSTYPANVYNRRPAMPMQNPSGHPNYAWNFQSPLSSEDSVPMQHNVGPRVFGRTPYYAPVPRFMAGPHIPGTAPIYYLPAAPPGFFPVPHPQHSVSHPLNHGIPRLPPDILVLRTNIIKQIEYYFSDQNLQNDEYLISAMDGEGWVPISTIADFKRVKRMSTDIPFILDALKSSDKIEVQVDKIRKFDEWEKWIPVSAEHSLSSEAKSNNEDLPEHHAPTALKNSELNEDSTKANYENTVSCSSNDVCEQWTPASAEHTLSSEDQSTGDSHNATPVPKKNELDEDNTKASSEGTVECSSYNEIMENTTIRLNIVAPFSGQNITFDKTWPAFSKDDHQTEVKFSSELTLQERCDFSDDTFLLDEELEHEQKAVNDNNISSHIRIEDEDDEIVVNDHDVQGLIIVTQNGGTNGGCSTANKESQSISSEHASVINDGLYFYEQELKTKKSNRRKNKSSVDNRDTNSRFSSTTAGLPLVEPGKSSAGSNTQESGSAHPRRKQKKRFQKQEPSHMQRFFTNNYKNHGTGRSSLGTVSESPPSNSVGFFFGSTPPENHGPGYTKVSISPRAIGNLSGPSPSVGSLPRSFQSFHHPSHQLLEENGFKQQKYMKFLKRCLSDRKKSGIGCSEEMNTLYRFWSYFLREMYVPPMYEDFCKYALEDAAANYNYGVECLFRFYSYGLEKEFRENLYDDFEQFTLDFYKKGNLYGLEKYWAFHHYGDQHAPHKKHPELEKLLGEDYRSLDDFHRVNKEKATTSKEISH